VAPGEVSCKRQRVRGGGRGAPARRRARRAVDGRGYQAIRWSNSHSGAGGH